MGLWGCDSKTNNKEIPHKENDKSKNNNKTNQQSKNNNNNNNKHLGEEKNVIYFIGNMDIKDNECINKDLGPKTNLISNANQHLRESSET